MVVIQARLWSLAILCFVQPAGISYEPLSTRNQLLLLDFVSTRPSTPVMIDISVSISRSADAMESINICVFASNGCSEYCTSDWRWMGLVIWAVHHKNTPMYSPFRPMSTLWQMRFLDFRLRKLIIYPTELPQIGPQLWNILASSLVERAVYLIGKRTDPE